MARLEKKYNKILRDTEIRYPLTFRKCNLDVNKEICYTYDEKGNILTKIVNDEETIFSYGKGSSNSYETTSENLVKVGNQSISYDFIGNPTSYLGANLT